MKQLYAAGPLVHGASTNRPNGTNGASGVAPNPAVRAASAGVRPDELQAALAAANYAPPAHAADADRPLPVRLALLNTKAGRLLTHVAPNGRTYFAHTLLSVPATADAQLAAQTWGSPLWQRHEPDAASDLPELPYLPVAEVLDDAALPEWLAVPTRREMLEFVLAALLVSPPAPRVFLAAPADEVARVVYAVTRALPPGLLDDFSFSTYEADPLACSARLVGFDPGPAGGDLPDACYAGGRPGERPAAFNSSSGRRTEAASDVPFAAFAATALAEGKCGPLDDVKAAWQRLGLKEARHFDLVYRMARGTGALTKDEAVEALTHPQLAAWLSARTDALNQFQEWALEDRAFATASFSRAVQALRQNADATAGLAQAVRELGLKAVLDGDRDRAANALEVVLPMAAPAKANAVWGELLTRVPDPGRLTWEMRWHPTP